MLIALADKWVWAKWKLPPPCLVPCEHHQLWFYDQGTQLPVRKPHIYCIWHATLLREDTRKLASRATYVHQNYARRLISYPYTLYKNAHSQAQTAYSCAVRNDLGHCRVQMAWLAIKMSHSGSWMQSSLHHFLQWGYNDTHCISQVWWSELPLASGWGPLQFVPGTMNQQLSRHSMYGSQHTFGGQLLLF